MMPETADQISRLLITTATLAYGLGPFIIAWATGFIGIAFIASIFLFRSRGWPIIVIAGPFPFPRAVIGLEIFLVVAMTLGWLLIGKPLLALSVIPLMVLSPLILAGALKNPPARYSTDSSPSLACSSSPSKWRFTYSHSR